MIMIQPNWRPLGVQSANPKGPNVVRTINELQKTGIHVAYFTMTEYEFENYFREYKSALLPPIEFITTHPEYIKPEDNGYNRK